MNHKLVYKGVVGMPVTVGDRIIHLPTGRQAIIKEISTHPELAPTLSVCIRYTDNNQAEWINPDIIGTRWISRLTGKAADFIPEEPSKLEKTAEARAPETDDDGDAVKHLIVQGNPVDGFTYYGPFDTQQEAEDYVLKYDNGESWWHAKMTKSV